MDAARFNQPVMCGELTAGGLADGMAWGPLWATGSQVSEALTGTFPGHAGPVTALCLDTAADRLRLVSGSGDGVVHVRDFATGQPLGRPLRAHTGPVRALDLVVASGRTVLVSGGDDGVRLWDLDSRRPLPMDRRLGASVTTVAAVAWHGRPLAVCAQWDGTIVIADPVGAGRRGVRGPWRIVSLAVLPPSGDAPDGLPALTVATVHRDGTFRLQHLDPASSDPRNVRVPTGDAMFVSVTTGLLDGRPVFLSGDAEGRLLAWDAESHRPLGTLGPASGEAIRVLATAPTASGSSVILTAAGEDLLIHRPPAAAAPEPEAGQPPYGEGESDTDGRASGEAGPVTEPGPELSADQPPEAGRLPGSAPELDEAERSATGQPLSSPASDDGNPSSQPDRRASAPAPERLSGHRGAVTAVRVGRAASGELVAASGGQDGTVRTWRISRAEHHADPLEGHPAPVTALAATRYRGRDALAAAARDTLWIRDAETGVRLTTIATGHGVVTSCVAAEIHGAAVLLTGGTDGFLRVWDAESGDLLLPPLPGHTGWVNAVAAGRLAGVPVAATAGGDYTVRLWNLATGTPMGEPLALHQGSVTSVALAATADGGACLASGAEDRQVGLWRLAPDGQATPSPVRPRHEGAVSSVCVLPEMTCMPSTPESSATPAPPGLLVASAGTDRAIRLWDAVTGAPRDPAPHPHGGAVTSLAVGGPDGRPVLLSTGRDQMIRAWGLTDRRPSAVFHTPGPPGHACPLPGDRLAVSLGRDVLVLRPTGPT